MTFAAIGTTIGIGGIVLGGINAANSNSIAGQQLGLAQDVQGKQDTYNNMLMNLMSNPGDFLNSPIFQSTLNVGTQGAERALASQGFLGSGNEATALTQDGTSLASGQFFQQEGILAGLSGAQASSSPSQAGTSAANANQQTFDQLGTLLAALGKFSATGSGAGAGPG